MKLQETWNLKHLYKSDKDPQIEIDAQNYESVCAKFEKKYKNKDFIKDPQALAAALKDYENLSSILAEPKFWWYFRLKKDLDSSDAQAVKKATLFEQQMEDAINKTIFFTLKIGDIPKQDHKKFLAIPLLKDYQYFLECIFKRSEYKLSEPEEKIINTMEQTSHTMWVSLVSKMVSSKTVQFKGETMVLEKARMILKEQTKTDRRILREEISKAFKSLEVEAEAEINAIVTTKKIVDEMRGFKKPYSSTLLNYQNDEKTIEALVKTVTRRFDISHRFYKIHAKILGEKKILMADTAVPAGKINKVYDFKTMTEIIRSSLMGVGQEFADIFDDTLQNGRIDVYPRKGKNGGGYCWGMGDIKPYVLLNHNNDIRSVETLAHEMGHVIHRVMSLKQRPLYKSYTISTAEVASTFFEQIGQDTLIEQLSDKEKIIILHNKIMGDVGSIFRQIAGFNFETELHERIRKEGQLTGSEMASMLQKHLAAQVGPAVTVTQDDGYLFVGWMHIRMFFYVYSYAYGQIISKALYKRWKENPAYIEKIKEFLSAGGSMSPENIFKKIGIDTTKPEFFEDGLREIEDDIKRLEMLVAKGLKAKK